MVKLYTFGYLHSSAERTFSELIALRVPIIDVRYSAASHNWRYTGDAIGRRNGIVYAHISELGNTRYIENLNGDFREPVVEIANLEAGLDALYTILMQHRQAAIFCACSSVEHCHRRLLAQEARPCAPPT